MHVCIVGLKCYDLLAGAETPRYIGGIETQLSLLARGLAERGHRVSFITYDHGQPDAVRYEGVTVYKAFNPDAGWRSVRFIHPRWTGVWSAMSRADADLYLQMGAGCETGQVAAWCRAHQRPFVFAAASDADCVPGLPLLHGRRERTLYRWGLRQAAVVVSQTERQQRLLAEHFGRESQIIRGCCRPPLNGSPRKAQQVCDAPPHILWIGRIAEEKRPHLVLELAKQLPECVFDIVGDANADTAYARRFRKEAGGMPHVRVHGRVGRQRLGKLYQTAYLLLSTSEFEGFPVTFLEAWSAGLPTVASVDPDGVIARHGLGLVATNVAGLTAGLQDVIRRPARRQRCSEAARQYYLAHHTVECAAAAYYALFEEILCRTPMGPRREPFAEQVDKRATACESR